MNQILADVRDKSVDEESATGTMWSSGCRRPRIKHLVELLEAHGYTPRHAESRTDEGCEELRSWEVKDFLGCSDPGKSEKRWPSEIN